MLRPQAVDIVVVRSDVPRSNFSEGDLDTLADRILESKGLLRPLILEETGIEEYAVISGHLEFYASVRAYEKAPTEAEIVNAFIISSTNKNSAVAQVNCLEPIHSKVIPAPQSPDTSALANTRLNSIDERLDNIARQISGQRQDLTDYKAALEKANREALERKFPSLLAEINGREGAKLTQRLSIYGMNKNVVTNVVAARQDRGEDGFMTYRDLIGSVKGLGDKGLLNAITKWEQVNQTD